jgi:hypothetical protein
MTTPASVRFPGTFPTPAVAPVYIDGIPAPLASPPVTRQSSQDFWSSQPRYSYDQTAEELTISLGQSRVVNYVTLDLPHFPHTVWFWWWDGTQWQPLLTPAGAPLTIATAGSVPAVVDNPAALDAGLNPYHYGAGHWVRYDEQVARVSTTKLLLHMVRTLAPGQQVPVTPAGAPSPYPLGVRNLDFGLRILTAADVPPTQRDPVIVTQRQPFTTGTDVNGSPVQVAVRENRACDLLAGSTWRSAPQPSASSVASLYLDSRDASGNPQLVSAFSLQPVTSGVRFNLYWSADAPPAGTVFEALDDPLAQGLLSADGTQPPVPTAQGIVFGQQPGWLDLSNQASGIGFSEPWWMGIEVMPAFTDEDPTTYMIADAGIFQISCTQGTWTVTLPDPASPSPYPSGAVLGAWELAFSPGDRIQFVAGYDGAQMFAWTPDGALFQIPATPMAQAEIIRFGGAQDVNPDEEVLGGYFTLAEFILKQEQAQLAEGVPPDFRLFAAGASAYVSPSLFLDDTAVQWQLPEAADTTRNAAARFDPSFVLGSVCPWGFIGGLGSAYESCSWTMIPRSYVLSQGYVEFDAVLAAAWKFEFTALQPETYEYLAPVVQTAQVFPAAAQPAPARVDPTSPAVLDAGLTVTQAMAPTITFDDAPPANAAPPAAGTVLPTEALYAPDLTAAAQLAASGGALYSFQPWQAPHVIPASASGPTSYAEASVSNAQRVGYFVALSEISMYASDYSAADDTAQYTENFATDSNVSVSSLAPGGWAFQPGVGLVTPANLSPEGATAQSQVLNSAHAVTGVQFATVQSPPTQLLADPDFSQPGFPGWGPVGDALPLTVSAASSQLGTMAQVTRGSAPNAAAGQPSSWSSLESGYGSWQALDAAFPSWLDFGAPLAVNSIGGIAYTNAPVVTSPGGRAYAAARVFSPIALSAPLVLQLLDGATGTVLAEAEQSVAGGTVTEWFAGFTLGSGEESSNTWDDVEGLYPTWQDADFSSSANDWEQVDTSVIPLGATVTAQLVQQVSTGDSWAVDNISVFDDAIVWQFSNDGGATWYDAYDVRNDPRGAILFPPAAQGQGTQLMWQASGYQPGLSVSAVTIRPWYVTWPRGIPPRPAGIGHGPNMSPLDQYPAIEDDPRWQMSSGPVPDDWFFAVRQALGIAVPPSDFPGGSPTAAGVYSRRTITWQPPVIAPGADQTWTDIYTDTYTDLYAPADGGDVYTDDYNDNYADDYPTTTGAVRSGAGAFSASAELTAAPTVVPLPAFGVGVDLGPVAASDPSMAAWATASGSAVPARRIALGNQIPASLGASLAAGDAGVRRVLFDFQPDATTTPAQLTAFLASCAAGGLEASVSIWAGADTAFANPQDWLNLVGAYAPSIRLNGYQHVLTISNAAVSSGWLASWYPGDELVDVIAPTFWCEGPAPGTGAPNLAAAAAFADLHGKPLGLGGFGADHVAYTAAQNVAFIAYVQETFAARKATVIPGYDLIWLGTGNYSIVTAPPSVLAAWQSMAEAL